MAENTKTHSLDNLIEFGKDENTKERVEKLTGILEQELTNVFESENYKRYLINSLGETFGFNKIVIRLKTKTSKNPYKDKK